MVSEVFSAATAYISTAVAVGGDECSSPEFDIHRIASYLIRIKNAGHFPFCCCKIVKYGASLMKQNIWEFLRESDGTYAVYHNGNLLSDSIPAKSLNDAVCVRYGFCGHEYEAICSQLNRSGKCTVDLNSSSPTHLSIRE